MPAPASSYRTYDEGGIFRISVPSNWREIASSEAVTFAPEGAYGQGVFTHGMQVGITRNETHDLQTATDELLDALAQSNPALRRDGGFTRGTVAGRSALRATLSNQSDATGQEERIALYTTLMEDGNLFYALGVAPRDEFGRYQPAFQRAIQSLKLTR